MLRTDKFHMIESGCALVFQVNTQLSLVNTDHVTKYSLLIGVPEGPRVLGRGRVQPRALLRAEILPGGENFFLKINFNQKLSNLLF